MKAQCLTRSLKTGRSPDQYKGKNYAPVHAMTTAYRRVEVNSQVQAPATLLPGIDTGTHTEGRWVRPSASLDVKKRKVSCLLQGIESQFLRFAGQSLVTTLTAPPQLLQLVRSIKCVKQTVLGN
jgi:hypothetical protein